MTNSHNIIFYIMLTALSANLISGFITRHSFYDELKVKYISEIHHSEVQEAEAVKIKKAETDEVNGGKQITE